MAPDPNNKSGHQLCKSSAAAEEDKTANNKFKRIFQFTSYWFIPRLLGLAVSVCWAAFILSHSAVYFFDTFVWPIIEDSGQLLILEDHYGDLRKLMKLRSDFTFYPQICDYTAVTSTSHLDLVWNEDNAKDFTDFSDLMMHHGVGVIEDLLSPAMSKELRDTILLMNAHEPIEKMMDINELDHRWGLQVNINDAVLDPNKSVQRALKEIATNPVLKKTLVDLLGDDPAITELSAITSDPGAREQDWHQDTSALNSAMLNARTYSSMYSLFVYLQDTHLDMGPTGFAPGTHMCYEMEDVPVLHLPAKIGSAALYNSNLLHQGGGNTAYERGGGGGPGTRVMLTITFAPRPRVGLDPRQLPLGSVYGIPWHSWGHNLSELEVLDQLKPWNWMHALGLVKSGKNWGINLLLGTVAFCGESFNDEDEEIEWFMDREVWTGYASQIDYYAMIGTSMYMCVSLILLLLANWTGTKNYTRILSAMSTTVAFGVFFPCFVGTALYVFSKMEFGRGVSTHTRFGAVPFAPLPPEIKKLEVYKNGSVKRERLIIPRRKRNFLPKSYDIVLGERLDAFYTYRNAYFYDYHPGNQHFRNKLKEVARLYVNRPAFITSSKFVSTQILSQLWMQNKDEWHLRAFVRQDDYGYWIRLTNGATKAEYVRREVLGVAYPVLRVLNKEIDFILSQCKYGDGARNMAKAQIRRGTAMARVHVPKLMESLREELFADEYFNEEKKDCDTDSSSTVSVESPMMKSVNAESKLRRRMSQWRFERREYGPLRGDFVYVSKNCKLDDIHNSNYTRVSYPEDEDD